MEWAIWVGPGGYTVARASVDYGWGVVFMALAVVSLIAAAGAGYLFRLGLPPRQDTRPCHEPRSRFDRGKRGADALIIHWSDGAAASSPASGCATTCQRIATVTAASVSSMSPICRRNRAFAAQRSWEPICSSAGRVRIALRSSNSIGSISSAAPGRRPRLTSAQSVARGRAAGCEARFCWQPLDALATEPPRGANGCCDWCSREWPSCMMSDTDSGILEAMTLAGRVAQTNYGLVFDVRAVPHPKILPTRCGLGLHTDTHTVTPCGFPGTAHPGGGSGWRRQLFADGWALAAHLRDTIRIHSPFWHTQLCHSDTSRSRPICMPNVR